MGITTLIETEFLGQWRYQTEFGNELKLRSQTEIPTNVVLVKSKMVIWTLSPSQDDIYTLT